MFQESEGPSFLEVKIENDSELTIESEQHFMHPLINKKQFMKFLTY